MAANVLRLSLGGARREPRSGSSASLDHGRHGLHRRRTGPRDQSVPREHVAGLLVGARRRVRQRVSTQLDDGRLGAQAPSGDGALPWRRGVLLELGGPERRDGPVDARSDLHRCGARAAAPVDEPRRVLGPVREGGAPAADWRQLQLPPESVGATRRVGRARRAAGAARLEARLPGRAVVHWQRGRRTR